MKIKTLVFMYIFSRRCRGTYIHLIDDVIKCVDETTIVAFSRFC